jgi:putative ABC transport system permease protein
VIVLESFIIAILGALAGWVLAHAVVHLNRYKIEDQTGMSVNFLTFSPAEAYILPVVLGLALIAALLPAIAAYRTDVGSNLAG